MMNCGVFPCLYLWPPVAKKSLDVFEFRARKTVHRVELASYELPSASVAFRLYLAP